MASKYHERYSPIYSDDGQQVGYWDIPYVADPGSYQPASIQVIGNKPDSNGRARWRETRARLGLPQYDEVDQYNAYHAKGWGGDNQQNQGNQPMPQMPYTNYANAGATPMANGRPVKPQQRPSQYQMPGAGAPPIQQTYVGQGGQLWNHPNPVQKPQRPMVDYAAQSGNRPMQGSNPGTPQYLPHQIGGMNVGRPGVRPAANTQVGGGGAGAGMGPTFAPPTVAPTNQDGSFTNSYGNPQTQAAMGQGGMPQGFYPTLSQAYQNAGSMGAPNLQALTQNFPGFGQMLNGMAPSGSRTTTSTQRMPSQSMYRVRRQSYSF